MTVSTFDRGDWRSIDRVRNIDRFRDGLVERGLSAAVVDATPNKLWLTGFGGAGRVVVTPDNLVVITDPRYADRAVDELAANGLDAPGLGVDVAVCATAAEATDAMVAACGGFEPVGAEGDHLTHDAYLAIEARLALTSISGLLGDLRRHKQDGEIDRMRFAARCASDALAAVAPQLAGMTERDAAAELDLRMRDLGADGPGYDTIVAAGPQHSARPHHSADRRQIVEGDTVIIDVGAAVDGYRSDMTRTFIIGEPSAEQVRRHRAVVEAQAAGRDAVRVGAVGRDIDATCRSRLAQDGLDALFIHGLGHGVGLEIHEAPLLGARSTEVLRLGDAITVEPGVYEDGVGGVRIEDLGVVTDDGYELLTIAPYAPTVSR